jgi:hypothetical protein
VIHYFALCQKTHQIVNVIKHVQLVFVYLVIGPRSQFELGSVAQYPTNVSTKEISIAIVYPQINNYIPPHGEDPSLSVQYLVNYLYQQRLGASIKQAPTYIILEYIC